MPGILPMRVIRVGDSTQSRIAQACDRCRSKKIRCDGIRPRCSQCANVGFECKTSDKLSRRAFPRGYTESLEDRVRALQAEVRELKDLVDEKDEKIDVLSRIKSFPTSSQKKSASPSEQVSQQSRAEIHDLNGDSVSVGKPLQAGGFGTTSNQSCSSAFVDAFAHKVVEHGINGQDIRGEVFETQLKSVPESKEFANPQSNIPPRLLSDHYINIFFQEWAPLLPILHRPVILHVYEQYLAEPENEKWVGQRQAVAQLFLIFEIAATSAFSPVRRHTVSYEPQWRHAIASNSSPPSITTVQCHILAQLNYLLKADYSRVACHAATSVSLCHQLGLHGNQNHQAVTGLESETRKKVFWCQYALDKFTSALSGSVPLLHDSIISVDFPAEIDDDDLKKVTLPALTGEPTNMSSAVALFKVCRILSRALDHVHAASSSPIPWTEKIQSVLDDLDQWLQSLPTHLRLKFSNDKPSTEMISDRSPILSLAYYFVRSLIHRRVICHGLDGRYSSSLVVVADSAKHVAQILELLDERKLSYTFLANKAEMLLLSGFSLLWQWMELSHDSKLAKDSQKWLKKIRKILTLNFPVIADELHRVACSVEAVNIPSTVSSPPQHQMIPEASSDTNSWQEPSSRSTSARRQRQMNGSRVSSAVKFAQSKIQDACAHAPISRVRPVHTRPSNKNPSQIMLSVKSIPTLDTFIPLPPSTVNLDYLPLGEEPVPLYSNLAGTKFTASSHNVSGQDFGGRNGSSSVLHDGLYDGFVHEKSSQSSFELDGTSLSESRNWLGQPWPITPIGVAARGPALRSVFSTSEESICSDVDQYRGEQ